MTDVEKLLEARRLLDQVGRNHASMEIRKAITRSISNIDIAHRAVTRG